MHEDIQPLKVFHFGGDEVPHGAWVGSPECSDFNMTAEELKVDCAVLLDLDVIWRWWYSCATPCP